MDDIQANIAPFNPSSSNNELCARSRSSGDRSECISPKVNYISNDISFGSNAQNIGQNMDDHNINNFDEGQQQYCQEQIEHLKVEYKKTKTFISMILNAI